ncbi:MAG: hypothetical protein F6J95_031970 [Leptolyngbya sp. SIO1E4]|nr:hypothetical protein [Leptolyngbya sp. SIO1E4]
MNLPTLLSEKQIRSFNYYWEGEVRPGMSVGGCLYALLDCFSEDNRAAAYERGCQLASNHDVVLTVSQSTRPQYRLWIALSASTDLSMLSRAGTPGSSGTPSSPSKTSLDISPSA